MPIRSDSLRTRFDSSGITRDFRAERNQSLYRVLRRLPGEFLVALIEGLERADVIKPGRLFAGREGGCAVGVTLRALEPRYRGRRLIWGRRTKKSVRYLRRDLAKQVSHLHALEHVFDHTVELAQERYSDNSRRQVAKAVALWVADEARTELVLREMHSEWMDEIVADATRLPDTPRAGCSRAFASAVRPAWSAACAGPGSALAASGAAR
jgi:hypothetical protein